MSLCRIQQLRQHSTFDYKASCQERLFQGRRRFVLRNHTQIFCLRTRKKAHASAICTCKHALACPCRDERYVMSLPDLVLHTFSQKRKLVFLCFLRVIHQKHETPAPAVQIGSGALKQMAETEAIRQASSKPSDNAASPSTASLRRPVPEIFIACHPSSSAIRARSPRSVVLPEPRGPTRRMRRPGAPGPSQIPSRMSSLTDALSLWKAVRRASVASSGTGPVFTMAHPSFGSRCPESAEFSRHGRKSPAAQSLQGMERVKQNQPGKPRRHHADACTILGHVGQAKMAYAGQFAHGKALQIPDGICSPPSRSAGARPSCAQFRPKHPFRLQCLSPDIAR